MFEISVKSDFAAAHRLEGYPGNCANIHGHNWIVEVVVAGEGLNGLGMVMDFRELKKSLRQLLERLDHQFLNELKEFSGIMPTTENVAKFVYTEMTALCSPLKIKQVKVWESARNCATYYES